MTFEQACKILNTNPNRDREYLREYAAARFDTFTISAPVSYKVAATTIIRHCS